MKKTLAYARLGLVSLSATIVPITATAQELCGSDLFAGQPDAASLMDQTLEFIDILETSGVIAFQGNEGRLTTGAARQALQDGTGSASLLACVVSAEAIEFSGDGQEHIIRCSPTGVPSLLQLVSASTGTLARPERVAAPGSTAGHLFCTTEVAALSQYLGSQA
ncbi:MAG: hypothetical protein AAGA70_08640 [Pseudomonadota bacterium]